MYSRRRPTGYGNTAQPTAQPFTFPASVKGIDGVSSLMQMDIASCVYTYNMMPVEYGMRIRKGYREWAVGCQEAPVRGTQEVRTIIPFEAKSGDPAFDRLFAVTDEGIWDVTLYGTTSPEQVAVFTELGNKAGLGVYCEFTGDAADGPGTRGHYLFYADGLNGLWQYEQDTDTWTQPPSGTADTDWYYLDPTDGTTKLAFPVENIAFVMVHKQRIWVILEDDDDAWYLPLASISGELKRFYFGSKMPHGGNLMGLWSWTVDGGDGVDDMMVSVGRGGDVLVWRGDDPEITADGSSQGPWSLVGAWFTGATPDSRRIVEAYGKDLFLLSAFGVVGLQALLSGLDVETNRSGSPSANVNRWLRADVRSGADLPQWQLVTNPSDGQLQIIPPNPVNHPHLQYSMNLMTGAWGMWSGVPITCAAPWNFEYYMGAAKDRYKAGTVLIYDGVLDGQELTNGSFFEPNDIDGNWTQTAPDTNEYALDNSAGTDPEVGAIAQFGVPTLNQEYLIQYTVTGVDIGVQHTVSYGGGNPLLGVYGSGSGTFVYRTTADAMDDAVYLVGGAGFNGTISNIQISVASETGQPINFRLLTSFQAISDHATLKRVGVARTIGFLSGTVNFNIQAVYDYQIEQIIDPPEDQLFTGGSVWDSALWDNAIWDYSARGAQFPVGVLGMGRAVAIGMRGESTTRATLIGWDLILEAGGLL